MAALRLLVKTPNNGLAAEEHQQGLGLWEVYFENLEPINCLSISNPTNGSTNI
jgi:hypothetical protein